MLGLIAADPLALVNPLPLWAQALVVGYVIGLCAGELRHALLARASP